MRVSCCLGGEGGKWRRCELGSFDPRLLLAAHLSRSMTATKKPSVPWLKGVMRRVSSEPSAEPSGGGGRACSQSGRQGTSLNSGCRVRKAATWSRFSEGSTEQVI